MGKREKVSQPETQMRAEAMALVVQAVERGRVREVDRFVEDLVERHPGISGKDADWYRVCAYGWTREIVRDVVRQFTPREDEKDSPQLVMDGFEKLKIAYAVDRDGRQMLVPLPQMTSVECRAKAEEYKRFAKGALIHARELERYADTIDN